MSLSNNRRHRFGLLAIFVLSGFAGLIYQSIWSHYLGLFLGHAAYAQALVLAIFMGGMAIGAAWIAKAGQRWRNLIRGYAVIEAVIGVLGLLFHGLFTHVVSFSYDTLIPALGDPMSVNVLRWVIAATLILPQTILLGMTFPLMSGGLIRRFPDSQGNLLGGLYFTNSIGAAIGALMAVFVLLPWVGLPGAMITAGMLNFVVATLAWWLAREPEPQPIQAASAAPEHSLRRNPLLRVVLLGTALSGAASFAYEIVWIRMLSMAVGSTMHAFELMLASFIAGIALGGLWVRKRADTTDAPLRLIGWMQVFMGVAALASLAVYANAFSWVSWLIGALAKTDGGYALFNLGTAAIAIAIMLPAAFFAGTTLPLFTVALLRAGQGERAIGRVYAWNTLGSIAGVFAAIHLLIPVVGLKLALCVAALVDLGLGLFLLRWQADSQRAMLRFGLASGLAALALVIAVRIPFDPMTVASGVFRHGFSSLGEQTRVTYYQDGKTASVATVLWPDGKLHISTNGKVDAAIQLREGSPPSSDEPTMVLLGSLPLALSQAPRRIGVIGFGSGLTTHTLLGDARVQHVDTIEIEPAMVQGAKGFGPRVERAFTDPRSRIVIDDAKAYFAGQRGKYDLIISEPSNPWISGVGSLFSQEFYRFVPQHLNEGGLFVQWVQLYEIDDALIGSILKALTPAFADYSAWLSSRLDLLIVASPHGPLPALDMTALLQDPKNRADLQRVGLDTPHEIRFRQVADARLLRALGHIHAAPGANSDYHPVLGLNAPRARFKGQSPSLLHNLPILNRPLLEALGISNPLPDDVETPATSFFVADELTADARTMAAEIRGSRSSFDPSMVALHATARACASPWPEAQRRQLAETVANLADRTIKFLPPTALQGVWIQPTWLHCPKNLTPDLQRALAMLDAHARRDYPRMQALGNDWIKHRPQDGFMERAFDGYAWSGMALALVRQQRWAELPAVIDAMEKSTTLDAEYSDLRRLLRALADEALTQRTATTATSAP